MNIINKDITTVESGIIVHQVNCQGVMGGGVAKAIREKWPQVYEKYRKRFSDNYYSSGSDFLASIDICHINDNLYIVNLYGQNLFKSNTTDKIRFTSYAAWEEALPELKDYIVRDNLPKQIYFPYLVGCGLGGGDWRIISAMIEEYFPDATFCKV